MPYLIDGNNLIFALAEAGPEVDRVGLCELLAGLVTAGEKVRIVFDGPAPGPPADRRIAETGVAVTFCPGSPADDEIIARIQADSAPRLLTVVSTDRQLRRAATRRKCTAVTSEDFARRLSQMLRVANGPAAGQREPREKRTGLTAEETKKWLAEFGLDGE